ncbi:hypothetical protein Q5752_000478 [Cryptotrichosporon argae]
MDNISDRSSPADDDADLKKALTSRACDFCHRMKMKCIGKETPPCNRCRHRLKMVEDQMNVVQSSLAELLALQRASMRPPQEPYQAFTPTMQPPVVTPNTIATVSSGTINPDLLDFAPPDLPRRSPFTPSQATGSHPGPLGRSTPRAPAPAHPILSPPLDTSNNVSEQDDDEDDQDPLEPSAIIYNNMLSLAEAARLKADGHMVVEHDADGDGPKGRDKRKSHPFNFEMDGTAKRARTRDEPVLKRALPLQRGNHVHAYKDAVDLGFCTAERGKQLFDLFMAHCAVYVPIFDPEYDTWDSLRKRSPFIITTIIMIGAKVEDAGGPVSDLQSKCRQHAENIGMSTLFTPVARIELLQAMILLAGWGDTCWRPSGHALRMAMDMGLYRCLPYLAQTGMGAGKPAAELEDERPLVVGARLWLALYKTEYEMAYNLGRPALFSANETISKSRYFLEHPLSRQNDSRLVATCELLTLRASMHQPFSIWPAATRIADLDAKIRRADETYDEWLAHWESFYEKQGVPASSFLRESLYTQKAHAVLHTNSRVLHGVQSRRDVPLLSEDRRSLLLAAIRSAQTLVNMSLRSTDYTRNLPYANHYTHVGIAFAARFLIRLTSLMPEAVDTRQTGRDVEQLANILARVPGFQFAQHLREVLKQARRRRVLPPATRASSPTLGSTTLPPAHGHGHDWSDLRMSALPSLPTMPSPLDGLGAAGAAAVGFAGPQAVSMQPGVSSTTPENGLIDFTYAEQLFANNMIAQPGMPFMTDPTPGQQQPSATPLVEPHFALDSWFPFPPLEGEGVLGMPWAEADETQGRQWQ